MNPNSNGIHRKKLDETETEFVLRLSREEQVRTKRKRLLKISWRIMCPSAVALVAFILIKAPVWMVAIPWVLLLTGLFLWITARS